VRGQLPVSSIGGSAHPRSLFGAFASKTSQLTGKPITFLLATAIVIVWAASGPYFAYSDTWQLVINTGTTIVTFLMVFLIQNTQNRDTVALQLKLDELILANKAAPNNIVGIEDAEEGEIEAEKAKVRRKAERQPN
jgi:low affinity Fe/Cu permease